MWSVLQVHRVDPARQDVYLASVRDQEIVLEGSSAFQWRLVLSSQVESGLYWLVDGWSDLVALQSGLAASRTIASVAALVEPPVVTTGRMQTLPPELGPNGEGDEPTFVLAVENWVKAPCLSEYLATLETQAERLRGEAGFQQRLLLRDTGDQLHFHLLDRWSDEEAAFASFGRRRSSPLEAVRFLSLLAERGRSLPAMATLSANPGRR
jgi:quinol monooxygenase YgiN